jgi:hypothetical protein
MEGEFCRNTTYCRQPAPPFRALQVEANHVRGYAHAVVLRELDVKQKLVLRSRQFEEVLDDGLEGADWSAALCKRRSARSYKYTSLMSNG